MNTKMMKRWIAILTVALHVWTYSMPLSPAAVVTITLPDGSTTTVDQFNVGADDTVNMSVVDAAGNATATGRAIYQITGGTPSWIDGIFNTIGIIALLNAAGFNVGATAAVNVTGGLIMSTLGINQQQFFAGMAALAQDPSRDPGFILNQGKFNVNPGSFLALVAGAIRNTGQIAANGGTAVLAAGKEGLLTIGGDGLVSVKITKEVDAEVYDFNGNKVADQISNEGAIAANGGVVHLTARGSEQIFDSIINHTGIIEAKSISTKNGKIVLDGGDEGIVSVNGTLDASGKSAGEKGGTVHVLGDKVGLFEHAKIDVSGYAGGGEVLVGGDYQGKGTVKNANFTYMDKDAEILADALVNGNGGKVILWANNATRAYGTISAKGGSESGNGGFVETSAHGLEVDGIRVDTSAQNGQTGTWLLDPYNVTITASANANGGFTGTGTKLWTPSASGSNIQNTSITSNLSSSNVKITTTGGGLEAGNITIDADIDVNGCNNKTLTFEAHNDITLNNKIYDSATASINKVKVVFTANSDDAGGGDVNIKADVNTYGGTFDATGVAFNQTAGTINTSVAGANGGNVTVTATGAITTAGGSSINTQGGAASGDSAGYNGGNVKLHTTGAGSTLTASGTINTSGSNASGTKNKAGGDAGDVTLTADSGALSVATVTMSGGTGVASGAAGKLGNATLKGTSVSQTSGTITGNEIALEAMGGAVGTSTNRINTAGAIVAAKATGDIYITEADDVTIGAAGSYNGLTTTAGNSLIDFKTTNGNITDITQNINANGSGSITLEAAGSGKSLTSSSKISSASGNITLRGQDGVTLNGNSADVTTTGGTYAVNADTNGDGTGNYDQTNSGTDVSTNGGAISITANDINDLTGTLSADTGNVTILVSDGGTIGLGATAGNMTISGAELQQITAGKLMIGDGTNGAITVNGITATNSNNVGEVVLNSTAAAGSVTFQTGASVFNQLTTNAGNGINVNIGVSSDTKGMTFNADWDGSGAGAFMVATGVMVNSSGATANKDMSITAADLALTGTGAINASSTGNITFLESKAGDTIGLGATAGNMTISGAELQQITAGKLMIGDGTNGAITVNGITATNSNNVGEVVLNSTAAAGTVTFQTGASTFNKLSTNAGDGINVNIGVSTDTNGMTFNADSDGSGAGIFAIAATGSLDSSAAVTNRDISIEAAGMSFGGNVATGAGKLNLTSTGAISQTAGALSVGGTTTIIAGANNVTLNSTANDFSTVAVTTGKDVVLVDSSAISLGASAVSGDLSVKALNGDITQSGALDVSGAGKTATFEALATKDITLSDGSNDFTTVEITNGRDVTLADANAIDLGASTATGKLDVTANGGDITQSGKLEATDLAFSATGAVTLEDTNNNFDTVTGAAGGAISLKQSGSDTEIKDLTTVGNSITYDHSGDGDVTVTGTVSSGKTTAPTVDGGDISITSNKGLTVDSAARINTKEGTGGNFSGSGATYNLTSMVLGAGDITLAGGSLDTIISGTITQPGAYVNSAVRDVIVDGVLTTTSSGSQISLTADSGGIGSGGVWIKSTGGLDSAGDITLIGSNIIDPLTNLGTGVSVQIDSGASVAAKGDITLQYSAAAPTNMEIIINGTVTSTGTGATITVDSNGAITTASDGTSHLTADNLAMTAANGIDVEIDVDTVAFLNTTKNNVGIEDMSGGVTVGTVGALVGGTNNGGDATIVTHSPLTIAADMTAGTINLTAGEIFGAGDDLTVNSGVTVKATTGNVNLNAGDNIDLQSTSVVTSQTGSVALEAGYSNLDTFGDMSLAGDVNAATTLTLKASAAGAIDGGAGTLTANTIGATALSGIGGTTALNTAASSISADTTNGAVDINNALATAVTATSLTTGTGNITFDQTGGGNLSVTTATTTSGGIVLQNTGGDLDLTTVTAGGTNDITLTTITSGNINVGNVTATGDDVTVTSAGAIEELGSDVGADITSKTMNLSSVTGIGASGTLEIKAVTLTNASVSGTGAIDLSDRAGGLAVTSATTNDGAITLDAVAGNLNLTTVTAGGSNNITLSTTTSGDINVGNVTATGDDVTVTSAGAIEELGSDAGADITSKTMNLSSVTGIGASGTLEIKAVTLTNASVSGTGAIDLSDRAGGLAVTSATTNDGAITLDANGGDLDLTTVTAGGTGRDIVFTTTGSGNINLTGATTAASDTITINSVGNINGSGLVKGNTADLDAATGIGNTTALSTSVSNISADTTSGKIDIDNSRTTAVNATSLTTATGTGSITFDQTGGGDLTVGTATTNNGLIAISVASGNLTVTTVTAGTAAAGDGNVTLTTTTSGDVLVGSVSALADTVAVTSVGAIDSVTDDGVADVVGATLNLTAAAGGIGNTSVLDVTATTAINADSSADNSDIKIDSIGDAPVDVINAGTGAVTLSSTGNMTDTNDIVTGEYNGGLVNITAGKATLNAVTGIGTGTNAIEMRLSDFTGVGTNGELEASGGTGGVYLTNKNPTVPQGLDIVGSGVTATGGDIFVMSGSPLTIGGLGVSNTGGGDITLSALGTATTDDLTVNADIKATGGTGNVLLTAGDTISMTGTTTVSAAGTGTVTLAAGEDYTDGTLNRDGNAGGNVDMVEGTTVSSDDGNILLDARNDVIVGYANADGNGDGVRGDITVNAVAGSVLDENTGVANTLPDFKASTLNITAGTDIGAAADPIELDAPTFNGTAGGNTYIAGTGDTVLNMTSTNGSINFSTTGNITLGKAHAGNGQVNLTAGNSILSQGGPSVRVIANDVIKLVAGGVIGTAANPIQTQLNHAGNIFLGASGSIGMLSINVLGNFTRASVQFLNTPPGLALFNGTVIGGTEMPLFNETTSTLYRTPNPINLPQYGYFDGRYAADFPAVFDMARFAFATATSINTLGIDVLPIEGLGMLPPVVPIPTPAIPPVPAPVLDEERPPLTVPLPGLAKLPVFQPSQERIYQIYVAPGRGSDADAFSSGHRRPHVVGNNTQPFYVSPLSQTVREARDRMGQMQSPIEPGDALGGGESSIPGASGLGVDTAR